MRASRAAPAGPARILARPARRFAPMPADSLFDDTTPPPTGERFDTLLAHGRLVVERIVSSAAPDPAPYRQPQDEWVVLLRGDATLRIDGTPHVLAAGAHVFLPAGTPHAVERTSDGALWLAVHLHPAEPDADRACVHARYLPAPPARVLQAFAEPQRLARWWGPAGFTSRFEHCDFRAGGAWRFTLTGPDGRDHPNECVFREVGPSRVVIEHLGAVHHFLLTVTLEADGPGTRVGWRQVFDDAAHRAQVAPFVLPANEQNLDRLAAEVAAIGE